MPQSDADAKLLGIARLAAKLSKRDDLSDEEAVRILLATYNDCLSFQVDCANCAKAWSMGFDELHRREWTEREAALHDFWCQVVVFTLMTMIASDNHTFCCNGERIDAIPCDDCGAGY